MKICPYDASFDERIRTFAEGALTEIREDPEVFPESVRIAVEKDRVLGLSYIREGTVNYGVYSFFLSLEVNFTEEEAITAGIALLEASGEDFRTLRANVPHKKVYLSFFAPEDSPIGDFLLENGFQKGRLMDHFQKDLSDFPEDNGEEKTGDAFADSIPTVCLDVLDPAVLPRYTLANGKGFGYPDPPAGIVFRVTHWQAKVYAKVLGEEVLSCVSVWPEKGGQFATEDIFCIPEYRRRHLTENLLKEVFSKIRKMGGTKACLNAFSQNREAIRLYRKLGYEKTGEIREYYFE